MTGTSAIFVSVWSGSHSLNAEDKQMHRQQMHPIQRGDIFYADLAPVIGSEQGGIRPVLIIQNNIGNQHSPTIIAAIITGQRKSLYLPTHVLLDRLLSGLPKKSMVMLEQIRTLDRNRLYEYIGHLGTAKMQEVNTALKISVGLVENKPFT